MNIGDIIYHQWFGLGEIKEIFPPNLEQDYPRYGIVFDAKPTKNYAMNEADLWLIQAA